MRTSYYRDNDGYGNGYASAVASGVEKSVYILKLTQNIHLFEEKKRKYGAIMLKLYIYIIYMIDTYIYFHVYNMKCCLYICHKIRNNFRDMALCPRCLSYENLCEGKTVC